MPDMPETEIAAPRRLATRTYETYANGMGARATSSSAEAYAAGAADAARDHRRRSRTERPNLRIVPPVSVEEFVEATERTAEETGQGTSILLGVLVGAMFSSLAPAERDALAHNAPEATPEQIRKMLVAGSRLEANIRAYLERLRTLQPTEVTASEMRTNWADNLERVRTNDETIYITLHGKRVAALTPNYVAEQYSADQEWYWAPEWQAGEIEVDADKAARRVTTFDSEEAFLASLGAEDE